MELAQKALLVSMTNGQGWMLAKKYGNGIVEAMEREALDCDDETKIIQLTRSAKAARRFWEAFITGIDKAKNPEEKDDTFVEVSY